MIIDWIHNAEYFKCHYRGKNLLIFGTINVTIHLTDLPGTSVLDVTLNHNLSTSKFDCLLSEPWVQTGPWGSSTKLAALGMELNWWFIWKIKFSAVQPSVRLWALAYATRFLSCLLFSAGFWAAIEPWRPLWARIQRTVIDETGVAGVHSSRSCEADQQAVVSSSCLARSARPGSVMDVASLLVVLANPLHLPFRHIEDVCNFSRRLGLEILHDQYFGFWFDLGHVDRSNAEH